MIERVVHIRLWQNDNAQKIADKTHRSYKRKLSLSEKVDVVNNGRKMLAFVISLRYFSWIISQAALKEAYILYIHSVWKSPKNLIHFVCGQIVLPDRSTLIGQKLVENAKFRKFKWDILRWFSNTVLSQHVLWVHTYCIRKYSFTYLFRWAVIPPSKSNTCRLYVPFLLSTDHNRYFLSHFSWK